MLLLTIYLVLSWCDQYYIHVTGAQATIDNRTLDLDENVLLLEFSSALDPGLTVDCTKLRLGSVLNDFASSQPLSNPATVDDSATPPTVSCPLGTDLKVAIETSDTFGTGVTDTVLYIESGNGILHLGAELVADVIGVNVNAVDSDDEPPKLQSFTQFDLDGGIFVLSFTEPVDVSMFAFDELNMENDFPDPSPPMVMLSVNTICGNDTIPCTDSDVILIQLTQNDLNAIKLQPSLCTDTTDCVPKFTTSFVSDLAGNSVEGYNPINQANFLLLEFIADTTRPVLQDFDLDLSLDELTLVFDEPVSVGTFLSSEVYFQPTAGGGESIRLSTASVPQDTDNTTIVISLNRDADKLKIASFASDENNTYLYFNENSIQDLYGNNVSARLSSDAIKVRTFTLDTTPPTVSSFVLDLDSNQLVLTFSEPVQTGTLDTTGFTLSNSSTSPSTDIALSNITLAEGTDALTIIVLFDIDGDTLTAIKTDPQIGVDETNTFMSVGASVAQDTSDVSNSAQAAFSGTVVDDNTAATLVDFGLDMEDGLLSLTFNDVVDASSQRFRNTVAIQRAESDENPYRLTYSYENSDIVGGPSADSTVVTVMLHSSEVIALKATLDLATSVTDSFITIQAATLNDLRGFDIIAVTNDNAIQASSYIPDTTPPTLTSYDFDLDAGQIELTFDEPVDTTSFIFERFLIQETQTNGSEYVALSDGTLMANSLYTEIILVPSRADLNAIKINTNIATTVAADNTYLQLLEGALNDTASNAIGATFVNDTFSAIEVTVFTPDGTPPELESFVLDLDEGEIIITFDEVVNFTTIKVSLLQLQNDASTDGTATIIPITAATVTPQVNRGSFTLILTANDVNRIKLNGDIGNVVSTYMRALASVAVDMAGNIAMLGDPVEASDIIVDQTPPELDRFVLDLDSDTLELTFDEPVNVSSLQFSQFTLYSSDSIINSDVSISLSGSSASSDDDEISVSITVSVALDIKRTDGIGVNPSNTFLHFLSDSVRDVAGNYIMAMPDALQVSLVVEDMTGPLVESFDLDVDAGVLTLRFPEPVDPLTFDGQYITIQDNQTANHQYTFTGGTVNETTDSADITIQITDDDLNALKANTFLATSAADTYLVLGAATLRDTFGNELTPLIDGQAIQVTLYTNDTNVPTVETFELRNAANGVDVYLVVVFSETVNASTVVPTAFKLLESPGSTNTFQLTGGTVTETNTAEIEILISESDLATIKGLYPLGTTTQYAYISAAANAGTDMVGFGSLEVLDADAKQARNITADLIPPSFDSFVLDMDEGTLSLTFDEDVAPGTFNLTLLLLQNSRTDSSVNQTVQSSSVTSSVANPVVVIELSDDDLNAIKVNTALGTAESNTFISFSSGIVADSAENLAFSVASNAAEQATELIPDTTLANLLYFDLDMDDGTLTLEFDEAVVMSTLNLDQVEIQNAQSNPSVIRRLTDVGASEPPRTDPDGPIVTIPLPSADLFYLQRQTSLAVSNDTTYLIILNFAISDLNANRVVRIPNIDALAVRTFTEDTTPPSLTGFHMDLHNARMYLTFSEALQTVQSPPTGYINISSDTLGSNVLEISSTASIRGGNNDNQVQINFASTEYFNIILSDSCNTNSTCFVSLQEGTVTDYVSLPNDLTTPFVATDYTVDRNPPDLVEFEEFNLRDGILVLEFNEPVNTTTFDPVEVQLQTLYTAPYSSVSLTSATAEGIDEYFTKIQINLTKQEVDDIKLDGTVCSRRYNCYVSFLSGSAITDIAGNLVNNATGDNPVTEFTLDTDRPILEDYTLDLDSAVLTLTFNEPVSYISLNADEITIQSHADGTLQTAASYPLTGGISMGPDSLEIEIALAEDDVCAIKADDNLATSSSNTYIFFSETVITDLAHEPLNALSIPIDNAYPVTTFVNDSTAPTLSEFQLDLNDDRVLLTFNEPVRTTLLNNFTLFTLHTGERPTPLQTVTLSGGTRVTDKDGEKVIMLCYSMMM